MSVRQAARALFERQPGWCSALSRSGRGAYMSPFTCAYNTDVGLNRSGIVFQVTGQKRKEGPSTAEAAATDGGPKGMKRLRLDAQGDQAVPDSPAESEDEDLEVGCQSA